MKANHLLFAVFLILELGCTRNLKSASVKNAHRVPANDLDVSCLGPASADNFIIYLHGIDSVIPSQQEIKNREILTNIAKIKNIRFALPRAYMQCPTQISSICWGWKFDQTELAEILPLIVASRLKCFSPDKSFKLLGFSNGGYLLTNWYAQNLAPQISPFPFSIIASGSSKGQVLASIQDLSKKPPLTLIIGNQDKYNFDPSETFFKQLQSLKAPVKLIKFEGGHILDESSLLNTL